LDTIIIIIIIITTTTTTIMYFIKLQFDIMLLSTSGFLSWCFLLRFCLAIHSVIVFVLQAVMNDPEASADASQVWYSSVPGQLVVICGGHICILADFLRLQPSYLLYIPPVSSHTFYRVMSYAEFVHFKAIF
jgi:hypothetical protein